MGNCEVKPSQTVKLLGVVFDQELKWKPHVQRAIKRATKTCLAISRLHHLRPKQMRQLYQACVIPQMDYASTVWHSPKGCKWQISVLSKVQRLAAIKTISAFKTVATETLDTEAYLLPTKLRLQLRASRVLTGLQSLPEQHPARRVIQKAIHNLAQTTTFLSPLHSLLQTFSQNQLQGLAVIDTCPLPPWMPSPFTAISSSIDREDSTKVINQTTAEHPHQVVFTDAACKGGNLGAAAIILDQTLQVKNSIEIGVGSVKHYSIQAAEMIAVHCGIQLAAKQHIQATDTPPPLTQYTIACDSKAALQAISKPSRRTAVQQLARTIHNTACFYKESLNIQFKLQWIPGHNTITGNEIADRLAKKATTKLGYHDFGRLISAQRQRDQQDILELWRTEWKNAPKGQHSRKIDTATPSPHVRKLYDKLPRSRARLFAQLRTGHCWLRSYRMRFGYIDNDVCECGEAAETVEHVLVECPLLQSLRSTLRQKIGSKVESLSAMLGGKPQVPTEGRSRRSNSGDNASHTANVTATNAEASSRNDSSKTVKWRISSVELDAVLDFAEESQRFTPKEDATVGTTLPTLRKQH
jgi:ribonuclease HI